MAIDRDAAFAVIQRALETFNAEIGRAQAEQATSEETLAAVEYELNEMRKLIAENMLSRPSDGSAAERRPDQPSTHELTEAGFFRRRADRAA